MKVMSITIALQKLSKFTSYHFSYRVEFLLIQTQNPYIRHMEPLPAADQRHPWLRYQIEEHTEEIRHTEMRQDLAVRLRMVYSGEGQQVFVSHAWRRLFGIRGPLVQEFIQEFLSTCRMSDTVMDLDTADTLGQAPEKVIGVDLFTANVPHLLAQYLFRHAEGRKSRARLSGGHFIGRLAMHFGLVSDEGLRGLQVVTRELPLIDLHELERLHICTRYGDTWAWVAQGPERQQAAAAGALEADEDGQAAKEAAPEILALAPAPAQAPPPPPPAPQPRTMSQRIKRLEEEVHDLRRDVVGLRGDVVSFTTEQSRVSTWLISCMTQLMDASGQTYQPFDSTLVGSSGLSFRRRVRPRMGDASTSAALHTDAQSDP
ncbi:hypothetical protein Tco_1031158 [Tanacetum coccineum]|uniref:Uncharacterized protein n=1 Tax=Tanacetum coccineum TaxID=301880 RepID=A0ABQ5GAG6_9ASTR